MLNESADEEGSRGGPREAALAFFEKQEERLPIGADGGVGK